MVVAREKRLLSREWNQLDATGEQSSNIQDRITEGPIVTGASTGRSSRLRKAAFNPLVGEVDAIE